jgi:hypothetical protein
MIEQYLSNKNKNTIVLKKIESKQCQSNFQDGHNSPQMLRDGRQPAQSWHENWNFNLTISQVDSFSRVLGLFDIASTYRDNTLDR